MTSPIIISKVLPKTMDDASHDSQVVFIDVDGTLLAKDGSYSSALKQQIKRLHQYGIKTAIASGRPSYAAQFLFDELGISDVGVFCTGAEIYHPSEKHHLHYHALDPEWVRAFYQYMQTLDIYCELYTTHYHAVENPSDISRVHGQHLRVAPRIMCGNSVLAESLPVIKLLLGRQKGSTSPSLRQLSTEFPEVEFAFAHFLARPEWEFASVISRDANKKAAFDIVTQHYGIHAENVMSIGDSQSDMLFIQQAGVGVAMGNASDEVKAVADYITLGADDDGVAYALEKLVPNR
jgi:Cof subfamily protein (haloacid dehalogenase superfamily)